MLKVRDYTDSVRRVEIGVTHQLERADAVRMVAFHYFKEGDHPINLKTDLFNILQRLLWNYGEAAKDGRVESVLEERHILLAEQTLNRLLPEWK